LEYLGYCSAVSRLDQVVEVDELPTQFAGESAAYGSFTSAHKAD
jgi:hypothetical protein